MKRCVDKDGLTRKKMEEFSHIAEPFKAIESDFSNLFFRALSKVSPFYRNQPFAVLIEIKYFDSKLLEETFLRNEQEQQPGWEQKNRNLKEQLDTKITQWINRLTIPFGLNDSNNVIRHILKYNREIKKNKTLLSRMELPDYVQIRIKFYKRLRFVRQMQTNFPVFYTELTQSGEMDPSLAVLFAFLHNYADIAQRFNKRWEDFPAFYVWDILNISPQGAVAPKAWFLATKDDNISNILLPKHTTFKVKIPYLSNAITARFQTQQDYAVNDMRIHKVRFFSLKKNEDQYPAHKFDFVTSAWLMQVIDPISGLSNQTFQQCQIGLMIESPILLLREGNRKANIQFKCTQSSINQFEQTEFFRSLSDEEKEKVFNEAFTVDISTKEGWLPVTNKTFKYSQHRIFELSIQLDTNFPSTTPCSDVYEKETQHPVIRLCMNPDAWLFPYSWAKDIHIETISIHVEVIGLSNLEMYNELGLIDPAAPFFPFGVQAQQGAWLAVGNYEMAIKPVQKLSFSLNWQQLPTEEEGFYDQYKYYPGEIDNTSFRIHLEKQAHKRWKNIADNSRYLFATTDKRQTPSPRESVSSNNQISFHKELENQIPAFNEESFHYGMADYGFYRIVLDSPEMGFGTNVYRQLFATAMIKNSRRPNSVSIPKEPVIPILEGIEVSYQADETYYLTHDNHQSRCQLYYISPLTERRIHKIDSTYPHSVPFIEAVRGEMNMSFGIQNATGLDRIRIFLEMEPINRKIQKEDLPEAYWSYFDGIKWNELYPEAIFPDTTSNLSNTGVIEIQLPYPVAPQFLDQEGNFWLMAGIPTHAENSSTIRAIYLNPIEATLILDNEAPDPVGEPMESYTGTASFEQPISGISEIVQIRPCTGGQNAETPKETRVRVSQRISHRNRAVLPADYEQMVLSKFPEVEKVLCLPGISRQQKNKGTAFVTLVVMQKKSDKTIYPLCEHKLLLEIEDYLRPHASPFVTIEAIPPVYENVWVGCQLQIARELPTGKVILETGTKINDCIAPWIHKQELPVFGHSFSNIDLENAIKENKIVTPLKLSVAQLIAISDHLEEQSYFLKRFPDQTGQDFRISPSAPWCILVPDEKHLISPSEEILTCPGIDELRIGGTFVIHP